MFFTRTYEYSFNIAKEEFRNRLIGKHVTIHELDFEIYEQENGDLVIVPHAEQVTDIKTLPITTINIKDANGKSTAVIQSNIRQLDAGGPQLIMMFCVFMFIAAIVLFFTSSDLKITAIFIIVPAVLFSIFWLRMKRGYFDYVHKIRDYVKSVNK